MIWMRGLMASNPASRMMTKILSGGWGHELCAGEGLQDIQRPTRQDAVLSPLDQQPIDLEKHPIGSAGFIAECERLTALINRGGDAKPGTLGMLIKRYRAHSAFSDLAMRTQADYQRCFDYLNAIEDTPLTKFKPPLVVKIRDRAAEQKGRRFGNYVKTVLSLLFAWGRERGYVKDNPAYKIRSIRKPRGAPDANRPWADDEREAVLAALPRIWDCQSH